MSHHPKLFPSCPVCYDTLIQPITGREKGPKDPVYTTCGHIFHRKCVEDSIQNNQWERPCPMCRQRLGPLETLDLFGQAKFVEKERQGCATVDMVETIQQDLSKLESYHSKQNQEVENLNDVIQKNRSTIETQTTKIKENEDRLTRLISASKVTQPTASNNNNANPGGYGKKKKP